MPRIAVVGAGIGGLAAALSLAEVGCEVSVFDRADSLGEAGAGLQLSSNAVAVLGRLGVLEALEPEAVRLTTLTIGRGRDAARLARLPLDETARNRYGAPFLVSRRSDLHRVLLAAAQRSGVRIETGCGLSGWSQSRAGLRLDFAPGRSEVVDGLVGADGLHSTVRQQLHPSDRTVYGRRTAWRTLIETAALPRSFAEPCSNLWMGPRAHLVHYPVAAGRLVNVVAVIDDPAENPALRGLWSSPGDPAEIQRAFAAWAAELRVLIGSAPSWARWPLADRGPLQRWSTGAVTLLGDAAHPMLPFLAQGAAQALEDAAALGDAMVDQSGDIAASFLRYETARKARTARVQAASRRQAVIYHLAGPAALARDLVLSHTSAQRLLAGYDWLYGHSAKNIR